MFKILTGVDGLNFKLERKPILLLKFTFQNLMGLSSNFTYERKSQVLTEKYVHHEKTVQIKRMTIDNENEPAKHTDIQKYEISQFNRWK